MKSGVIYALAAATLFGASTPFAKLLVGQIPPIILAGLLYLGSGIGLLSWLLLRRRFIDRRARQSESLLTRRDLPWLAGAIAVGGVVGPLLLMYGLTLTTASASSLLLNMEGVFTTLLAWLVFHENYDVRILIGMLLIITAGVLLSWEQVPRLGVPWGAIAIVGACLCWAIDNNLTCRVSASDAVQIAGLKGLVAGVVNLSLGFALGFHLPSWSRVLPAAVVGLCGYGISLVLFVLALRNLGTARTGAYFSSAPFFGAVISILLLHEVPTLLFWMAAGLMGVGIWFHLTEKHVHEHTHEPIRHSHGHVHDEHHQHPHDFPWEQSEPHTHEHVHAPLTHAHPHYPDVHHRHGH
ncbi:MAG: EamA family transporter [Acidobacteria bacterium]|nr:EamA family transporter [Acidobacteriota bacterium]